MQLNLELYDKDMNKVEEPPEAYHAKIVESNSFYDVIYEMYMTNNIPHGCFKLGAFWFVPVVELGDFHEFMG